MNPPKPHFLLFCEGNQPSVQHAVAHSPRSASTSAVAATSQTQRWRFVLENVATGEKFQANDQETGCTPDRASLVAVLRGLEALEQPSKVTLVTNSRYVFRGLQYGLTEWRENDFSWEHFGSVQPIRNADVWKRIDRTLAFHEVQCRWMAEDASTEEDGFKPETAHSAGPDCEKLDCEELDCDSGVSPESETPPQAGRPSHEGRRIRIDPAPQAIVERLPTTSSVCARPIFRDTVRKDLESEARNSDPRNAIASTTVTTGKVVVPSRESEAIEETIPDESLDLAEQRERLVKPSKLFYPFALAWSLCKRILLAVWDATLRLDEEVESYLRCMLLLDPRHRRRK